MSSPPHEKGVSPTSSKTPSSSEPSDVTSLVEHITTAVSILNPDKQQIQDLRTHYGLIEVYDLTERVWKDPLPYIEGSYADIFKGKWKCEREGEEDICEVAVKVLRRVCSQHAIERKVTRESNVWFRLEHENILPLYGFCNDIGKYGALVSPWYENENAIKFIYRESKTCRVAASKRFQLWSDVVEGVLYLHSSHNGRSLVHGDLKPSNVLIDDEERARICDFGLTRIILDTGERSNLTTTSVHAGTARYLAHELAAPNEERPLDPTKESDIWALGCLGLELVFLREPYANCTGKNNNQIYKAIRDGISPPETMSIKDKTPEFVKEFWRLLERCWRENPRHRPTISELKEWVKIHEKGISEAKDDDFVLEQAMDDDFVFIPRKSPYHASAC